RGWQQCGDRPVVPGRMQIKHHSTAKVGAARAGRDVSWQLPPTRCKRGTAVLSPVALLLTVPEGHVKTQAVTRMDLVYLVGDRRGEANGTPGTYWPGIAGPTGCGRGGGDGLLVCNDAPAVSANRRPVGSGGPARRSARAAR